MAAITILRRWLRTWTPNFVHPMPLVAPARQRLDSGKSVCIEDAFGRALDCLVGSLWITHDGDPKDVIVLAGESYRVASRKRMIVHAMCNSVLRVQ